jgi:uncharacterized membrane protein YozB (DUF420 family)
LGLFNANAPFTADLNLLFQIVILVFLLAGVSIAKLRHSIAKHGVVMGIAVILNSVSIAFVMIPSSLSFGGLFSAPFSVPALVVLLHIVLGSLAEILGIWLVVTWAFRRQDVKTCAKKKNVMRGTILLWLIELFLGVYVYTMLYLPI